MKNDKAFEQSKSDKESPAMKEGSKKEEAMDKKQMAKPTQRVPKRNRAQVI